MQLPASAQSLDVNFNPTKLGIFAAAAGNNFCMGTRKKLDICIGASRY